MNNSRVDVQCYFYSVVGRRQNGRRYRRFLKQVNRVQFFFVEQPKGSWLVFLQLVVEWRCEAGKVRDKLSEDVAQF